MSVLLALCTCPDSGSADTIASLLVEEQIAACVSIVPGLTSVYRWQGKIERDAEVLLLIKTTEQQIETLTARVLELHPYDLPEIIAVPVTRGLPQYLEWVSSCISDDKKASSA